MEHLWAPWRNLYVKDSQRHEGNVFARIGQGSDDEAHFVLARGKSCFSLLNIYPYNTGHLMILPYRETGALEDLGDDEMLEMMTMLKRMKAAAEKRKRHDCFANFCDGLDGFIDRGGATIDGLEVHRVFRGEFLRELGGGFFDGVLIGAAKKMDRDGLGG